ncbi:N-acetylmuramoyl-L-alanine amidase [Marinilactibacillus piezotolerans]|uniref:N-acetylmuramoyl-L-alanine amidase n=1 Tax=Marinilactibacillus piezotolerans TaxID=258723 RepID=UPI0009B09A37|nr:N-acetylmuramoyl-L-alanine amidase [Marinilactibacillus piezotolerans]
MKQIRKKFFAVSAAVSMLFTYISPITVYASEEPAMPKVQQVTDDKLSESNTDEVNSIVTSDTEIVDDLSQNTDESITFGEVLSDEEVQMVGVVKEKSYDIYIDLSNTDKSNIIDSTDEYIDEAVGILRKAETELNQYFYISYDNNPIGWVNAESVEISEENSVPKVDDSINQEDSSEETTVVKEETDGKEQGEDTVIAESESTVNDSKEKTDAEESITTDAEKEAEVIQNRAYTSSSTVPSIQVRAHVQSEGWLPWVGSNEISGTIGKALRMEAFQIKTNSKNLGIRFQTQSAGLNWSNWETGDQIGGTTDQKRQLEGVRFELTGSDASNYDIYYRVHSRKFGWLPWAKNGQRAGTQGYDYRIESMQVTVLKKGDKSISTSENAYQILTTPEVNYRAHVQTKGWLSWVKNKATAGTVGESLRMEAFRLTSDHNSVDIQYRTRSENGNWTDWLNEGALGGTINQKRQLEGVSFKLTGPQASKFDIYYRVHSRSFGWMPWAKNGEKAGTEGFDYRIESMQVTVLPKNDTSIDTTGNAYEIPEVPILNYQSHVESIGWQNSVSNDKISGTLDKALRLEALKLDLIDYPVTGNIEYRTHVSKNGWTSFSSNGELSGTVGEKKRLEAVEIRLTGELATKYDIYYRSHIQSNGWLGWVRNGMSSGSQGKALRMEAIQIKIVPKGQGPEVNSSAGFLEDPLIYIDSGHGGRYSGAAYQGFAEKTINLQTAKKIEAILKAKGYRTKMSRTSDKHFSNTLSSDLRYRANEANSLNADIFLSVHFNAHPTSTQTGIEMYIYNRDGNSSNPGLSNNYTRIANSRSLATKMQSELIKQTGAKDRGVKEANFHVIRETHMPAVLLELGFMDNPSDLSKITTSSYQSKLAVGVTNGIDDYFGR